MRKVINVSTGEETIEPDAPIVPKTPEAIASEERDKAVFRIAGIKSTIIEHLLALQVGTPAEKAQALAAIGLLRAELALEKAKL